MICTEHVPIRAWPMLVAAVMLAGCSPTPAADSAASGVVSASPQPATPSPSAGPVDYIFPVKSKAARFGRAHHDYPATDIFAPCGTAAVAVTDGVVSEVSRTDDWTAGENTGSTRGGLSVSIVGTDGVRYYGSHLKSIAPKIVPGYSVQAGDVLGHVGHTGSAQPTPCHLHFGISPACGVKDWWNRRGALSPYPYLTSWQDGDRRSPVKAVARWQAKHGCPKTAP